MATANARTQDQTGPTTALDDEVERFTAIAESWWDPHGKFRPLHQINPVRIAYIRDHACAHFGRDPLADKPLKGLRLLSPAITLRSAPPLYRCWPSEFPAVRLPL